MKSNKKENLKEDKKIISSNWKITMNDGKVLLRPKKHTTDETVKILKAKGYKVEAE